MSYTPNNILEDQILYSSLLTNKGKEFRLEIPVCSELYTNLFDNCYKHGVTDFTELEEIDLTKSLVPGVFKSSTGKIVCVTEISKGALKYHTFYATKHFRESSVAEVISGMYLTSYHFDESNTHLIPEGFTYLIIDLSKNDVIPFHAIDSSLPNDLSIYWVYFALKKFKKDFYDHLDLSKTLDEKEKSILKEKGYI